MDRADYCIHNIDNVECTRDIPVCDCGTFCPFYECCDPEMS